MKKISVLIVDDHKLIRAGLRSLLELKNDHYDFLVEEANDCKEAVAKVKRYRYDIILVDYQMPMLNGAETTQMILKHKPNISVLALSNYNDFGYVQEFLEAGAKGYILKDIGQDELLKAITTVLNGQNYFTNEVALMLLKAKNKSFRNKRTFLKIPLTKTEKCVLKLIAAGYTSKQIADNLCLSKHSIDKYRKQLLEKIKANNTASLIVQARDLKLID